MTCDISSVVLPWCLPPVHTVIAKLHAMRPPCNSLVPLPWAQALVAATPSPCQAVTLPSAVCPVLLEAQKTTYALYNHMYIGHVPRPT